MSDLTLAIMAGGKSSRMGTNKAFVPLSGHAMIERILERVSDIGQKNTFLVANQPDKYAHLHLPIFTDLILNKGSLGGIYTALHHSQTTYTLVIACDLPFVNPDLLRHMVTLCEEPGEQYAAVVPRRDGYPQGLHAIYNQTCLPTIRARIDTDRLKVTAFYDEIHVRYVDHAEWQPFDPQGLSFYNVNTPDELHFAQQIAGYKPKD